MVFLNLLVLRIDDLTIRSANAFSVFVANDIVQHERRIHDDRR
jgi:hypothetical protein